MKICYISAAAAATPATQRMLGLGPAIPIQQPTVEQIGWIEKAISDAITNSIVVPLQTWLLDKWIKVIDCSFILCLSIAFTGTICGILGIKKGYQVTILSMVFYCLLRLFSWAIRWY